MHADAGGTRAMGWSELGVRVWEPAVLGEYGPHDQGVGAKINAHLC